MEKCLHQAFTMPSRILHPTSLCEWKWYCLFVCFCVVCLIGCLFLIVTRAALHKIAVDLQLYVDALAAACSGLLCVLVDAMCAC
jgi:hypothetical protein